MNETMRKPTTGRQPPSLFDKGHGIFYMTSHTDTAGHKAFDYPVMGHWAQSLLHICSNEYANQLRNMDGLIHIIQVHI